LGALSGTVGLTGNSQENLNQLDVQKKHRSFIAVVVFIAIGIDLLVFLPIGNEFIFTSHVGQIFIFIAIGFPCLISELRNPKYSKTIIFALAFLVLSCFSSIFSTQAYASFFGIYVEGTGWLFYLACICAWAAGIKLITGNVSKKSLMNLFTVAAIVNSLFSIAQLELTLHHIYYNGLIQLSTNAASGIFGNPVYFAEFITGILVMTLFRDDLSLKMKVIASFILGMGVELSGDRMAILVVLVSGVTVLIVKKFKYAVIMGTTIVSGYLVGFGIDDYFNNSPLKYQLSASQVNVGFSARIVLWKLLLKQILHNPFFGWGPESTERASLSKYNLNLAHQLNLQSGVYGDSHNFIVELLLSVGIVGIIPLLIFFYRHFKLAKGPLVYFVIACIPFALIEPLNIMVDLPILLALGASTVLTDIRSDQINSVETSDGSHLKDLVNDKKNISILNISVGIMLFLAIICSVLLIIGDAYYEEIPQTYYHIKVYNGVPTLNFNVLNRAVEFMPIYSRTYYAYGKSYGVLAGLAPNKKISIELAKKGEPYLIQALRISPFNASNWIMLGQLQVIAHNDPAALKSYEKALFYDPFETLAATESCFLGYMLKTNNYKQLCYHMKIVDPQLKYPWQKKLKSLL
jgi:O-antigen ligase